MAIERVRIIMDLYRIGTENGTKVYKKTYIGNIAFIVIGILLLLSGILFGTTFYYRTKYTGLMERNRVELELARTRTEQYDKIISRAEEINSRIGESLSRQSTTISGLREQIQELKERYCDLENLLNDCYWSGNCNNYNTSAQQ